MPSIAIVPPRPAAAHNRRASDRPSEQLPADLAPEEFRTDSMGRGARSISFSLTGHEHPIDPERRTVTCAVCKSALEAQARGESARTIVVEVSPETWHKLDGAAGRQGQRPPEFAAQLLEAWAGK